MLVGREGLGSFAQSKFAQSKFAQSKFAQSSLPNVQVRPIQNKKKPRRRSHVHVGVIRSPAGLGSPAGFGLRAG